jgi:hypothetical protein
MFVVTQDKCRIVEIIDFKADIPFGEITGRTSDGVKCFLGCYHSVAELNEVFYKIKTAIVTDKKLFVMPEAAE